jgi:hypothetical protein
MIRFDGGAAWALGPPSAKLTIKAENTANNLFMGRLPFTAMRAAQALFEEM